MNKDKFLVWMRGWGSFLILTLLALFIASGSLWATAMWGNDWSMWFTFPFGLINIFGAFGTIYLGMEDGVSTVGRFFGLAGYYLINLTAFYFLPAIFILHLV